MNEFLQKNIINYKFLKKKTYIFFRDYIFSTEDLKLSDYCLPGRLLAGKSAAKKLKKMSFNIYFFEGWSRENRRQKKLKKYMFYFFTTYIFWRAGRGKIGGKKI